MLDPNGVGRNRDAGKLTCPLPDEPERKQSQNR
jgi:hypothetical protein